MASRKSANFARARIAAAQLGRVAITVYGDSFATADAEFFREGSEARAPDAKLGEIRGWLEGRFRPCQP
jgi:hypothetical protein